MDTAQLTAIHNSLAKRIKLYEQRTGEFPPLDVLNEMRYGFRAALELLDQRSQRDADPALEANLFERIKHALQCAYHDLVDGVVIETMRAIDHITTEYADSYHIVGDRLMEILDVATKVEEKIVESRQKPRERAAIYELGVYEKWFDDLADGLAFIRRTAVPQIIRHDSLQRRRQRRHFLWTLAGVLLGAVGAILATIGLLGQ